MPVTLPATALSAGSEPSDATDLTSECSGPCCSGRQDTDPVVSSSPNFASRWVTNELYNNSHIHIWTLTGSYWVPAGGNLKSWNSVLLARSPVEDYDASVFLTVIRVNATAIQVHQWARAAAGWMFWAYKLENQLLGAWDFRRMFDEGWFQRQPSGKWY
eukprot:TRINITY_DN14865_c0_g1_i1.p1 TRINITY_DN14865_c0_g1~~TRINITY_DN14865_c0_g1_i1.p1  ORF type:complete len:159 (+),score=20.91 TRINITY_DN14865_c0_g1_i1:96-572(+)